MTLERYVAKYRNQLLDLPDEPTRLKVLEHCYGAHELDIVNKAMAMAGIDSFGLGDLDIECGEVEGDDGWEYWINIHWREQLVFRSECNGLPTVYLPSPEWINVLGRAHAEKVAQLELERQEDIRQTKEAERAALSQRLISCYGIRL